MYFQNVAANLSKFDAIAEAAIAGTHKFERAAWDNQKLDHFAYDVRNALQVLQTLAPMIPDSDVLRAEGLAMRALTIAKATDHAQTIADAQKNLDAIRNRPALQKLTNKHR